MRKLLLYAEVSMLGEPCYVGDGMEERSDFERAFRESEMIAQSLSDLIVRVLKFGLSSSSDQEYPAAQELCDLFHSLSATKDVEYRQVVKLAARRLTLDKPYYKPESVKVGLAEDAMRYYLDLVSRDSFSAARASKTGAKLESSIRNFDLRHREAIESWEDRREGG